MSSAFRLDQIYILCTVDCSLKIDLSHIYVSYTIFFFSLIWSSSGIKLSYLACNFYPSDSNDQHCWRVLLHVISSVLSTSTVYQNQLARLWKKKHENVKFPYYATPYWKITRLQESGYQKPSSDVGSSLHHVRESGSFRIAACAAKQSGRPA